MSTVQPRPPWRYGRFFGGLVVFLLVIGAGAGAGWFARERTVHLDTEELQERIGPAVVRVFATTCGGSGVGSGVLIGNGLVLTASSVVDKSLSIAVMTTEGVIRRANPLGTSADGVAVLRLLGRFDAEPVPLAEVEPEAIAPRAQLGFTEKGEQRIQPVGSARNPRHLSEVINPAKVGGPVVDRAGAVVGLVTGTGGVNSRIVPLGNLREYVKVQAPAMTPPSTTCQESRGPQAQVVPELAMAQTDLAKEARDLLSNFITLQNRRDFTGIRKYYSRKFASGYPLEKDRANHLTSFIFNPRLIDVRTQPGGVVVARMTVAVLFSSSAPNSKGLNCSRLDQAYELVREDGRLKYDRTRSLVPAQSCDTD